MDRGSRRGRTEARHLAALDGMERRVVAAKVAMTKAEALNSSALEEVKAPCQHDNLN